MEYQQVFACGAASTVAQGMLWIEANVQGSINKFVAYAVHNMVAILDLETTKVLRTIRGCTGVITSIGSCVLPNETLILVAACDDGTVQLTQHDQNHSLMQWSSFMPLTGLKASASALSVYALDDKVLISAADSKGNIILWMACPELNTSRVIHSTKVPSAQMAKALHIAELPVTSTSTNISCFVGSVDARIHIYVATKDAILAACEDNWNSSSSPAIFSSAGAITGHEEWVTCLSSQLIDSKSLFLASGSQDSKIRVWNVKAVSSGGVMVVSAAADSTDLAAELDAESDVIEGEVIVESNEDETECEARLQFAVGGGQYAVLLESLLVGHEDWITSVQWMPPLPTDGGSSSTVDSAVEYRLFSTSMDRNMVIWSPDATAGGVWVPKVRMGDIGGALGGSIGGNLLGFVGGCISAAGDSLIGVGYGGSFHHWTQQNIQNNSRNMSDLRWIPVPLSSGHFASVNDLSWSDNISGDFLTTVSSDQTCRIFASLKNDNNQIWKEISRPQVHGYDLNCLALSPHRGNYTCYTAGEEKLIRVFDAPNNVLNGLEALCGLHCTDEVSISAHKTTRVDQAYIPELGLSNKAREFMSHQEETEQQARSVAGINWTLPPLESQLADLTLWPEVNKMFGHNNEVMCMCISPDGEWIASTSKARDAATASILLWSQPTLTLSEHKHEYKNMQLVQRLPGHESTVVCLQFSPDSRFLVSSGKDRALCLYTRDSSTSTAPTESYTTFQPVVIKRSAHKRIVWDCCWTPDSKHIVTASRDGTCKIWRVTTSPSTDSTVEGQEYDLFCIHTFTPFAGIAVTAVDIYRFTPVSDLLLSGAWLLALGAENGDMQVRAVSCTDSSVEVTEQLLLTVPEAHAHGATVRRIRWRPTPPSAAGLEESNTVKALDFASCGEDKTVRVHRIVLG